MNRTRLQFKRKTRRKACGIEDGKIRTVLYMVNKKVNNMSHGKGEITNVVRNPSRVGKRACSISYGALWNEGGD